MYKSYLKALVVSSILLLAVSCGKTSIDNDNVTSPRIRLNVAANDRTKSAAVTTATLQNPIGRFVLDVYCDEKWEEFDGSHVKIDEGPAGLYIESTEDYNVIYDGADWNISGDPSWLANDPLRFWCHWPKVSDCNGYLNITAPGIGTSKMNFTYNLPSPSVGVDATNQQDIIFAYAEYMYEKESDIVEEAKISFNHPLSQICFSVCPEDGTFDVGLTVKSIEISNVSAGGTCNYDGTGTIAGKNMFTWTPSSTLASYSQVYDVNFSGGISPTGWTMHTYGNGVNNYDYFTCNNSFMMIPQTIPSTATIKIIFSDGILDYPREIALVDPLDDASKVWYPGYFYNYKIKATKIGRSISAYVYLADWSDISSEITVPLS